MRERERERERERGGIDHVFPLNCPDNTVIINHHRGSNLEVFCEKDPFKNFTKFTVKHLCRNFLFDFVEDSRPTTLFK